jgi:hypothetical protein
VSIVNSDSRATILTVSFVLAADDGTRSSQGNDRAQRKGSDWIEVNDEAVQTHGNLSDLIIGAAAFVQLSRKLLSNKLVGEVDPRGWRSTAGRSWEAAIVIGDVQLFRDVRTESFFLLGDF